MNFNEGLRNSAGQLLHAPGLRAGLILLHDAASREIQRVFTVRLFRSVPILHGVETGTSVWSVKTIEKQTRCAGMIFRGTGPKHTFFALNPFVADAVVIGRPARCR